MEYSELNQLLQGLKIKEKTETEPSKDEKHKPSYATVDHLQRDLNLFNDLNMNYNGEYVENHTDLKSKHTVREEYKNDDVNTRLGERGFTPGNSIYSGRSGPLQNVVIDMTPLSTRVIAKDKNKQ